MLRIEEEIEKLNKQIEEIHKKIKELGMQESVKGDIWRPIPNEAYYYIMPDGDILGSIDEQDIADISILNVGNYYKTREEAEHQAKVQKYTNFFRKYVEEHSKPIDWGKQQSKWALVYNTYDKSIEFYPEPILKYQGTIYASSKEVLQEAVDFVGEENVIKYVLGAKE